MKKYYKRIFTRNDNKDVLLFSFKEHNEKSLKELEVTDPTSPHLRWHPILKEWITYSAQREKRTSFPPKKYCPLCPSGNLNYPTEVPFKNFDVAVFPNRWPSFITHNKNIAKIDGVKTNTSKGRCEVIVYSSNHNTTVADMSTQQIELLIHAWIDRYNELLKIKDIKYVMPFENRGVECGVTLSHPHGQIYCYPFVPPTIQKEIKSFKENNYLLSIMNILEKKYYVYQDQHTIAFVPPFARYSYEIWMLPKKRLAGPWEFNQEQLESFALCLKKIVKGYDAFLNKKCPYIMGLHAAPKLNDKTFHFHIEFYPPLRSGDRPKILAGSESMAGVFVMDVLPEDAAKILREYIANED
tara:strand:- start:3556 stop:4617 length:1062 start_codon:yes stop_codon:yes gene_type:complete